MGRRNGRRLNRRPTISTGRKRVNASDAADDETRGVAGTHLAGRIRSQIGFGSEVTVGELGSIERSAGKVKGSLDLRARDQRLPQRFPWIAGSSAPYSPCIAREISGWPPPPARQ